MRRIARIPALALALSVAACSPVHPAATPRAASAARGDVAAQGEREQTADESGPAWRRSS